jgi:hypothetical protein
MFNMDFDVLFWTINNIAYHRCFLVCEITATHVLEPWITRATHHCTSETLEDC